MRKHCCLFQASQFTHEWQASVKVKLSLCTPLVTTEVQLHAFLTSALGEGEWLASRLDGSIHGESDPGTV
jgi:hypothetical protein